MMKKIGYICLFVLTYHFSHAQHTAMSSLYLFNRHVINPAFTGSNDALLFSAGHRSQWLSFEGAPQTQNISIHGPFRKQNMALGIMAYSDKIGVTSQNGAFLQYAYRVKTGNSWLSFGLSAGALFMNSAWDKVATVESGDPGFMSPQSNIIPDAGFGIAWYSRKFYAGVSFPFLIADNFISQPTPQMVMHNAGNFNMHVLIGGDLRKESSFVIKPSLLVKVNERKVPQADVNIMFLLAKRIGFGVAYRTEDALVFPFQYNISQLFMIGYAYDMTLSRLRNYQFGSHEIVLQLSMLKKVNVTNARFL